MDNKYYDDGKRLAMDARPVLSIVVPVYNETEVLPKFYSRLAAVLRTIQLPPEIVFVNDGSTDLSLQAMRSKRRR